MYIYKEKQSLAFILLTLFGFVLLWAVVTDAWGYSSNLAFNYGKQVYALLSRLFWVFPAICLIKRHSDSLSIGKKGTVFEACMEQASCCYTSHIGGIGFCWNADHSCGIVAQSGN